MTQVQSETKDKVMPMIWREIRIADHHLPWFDKQWKRIQSSSFILWFLSLLAPLLCLWKLLSWCGHQTFAFSQYQWILESCFWGGISLFLLVRLFEAVFLLWGRLHPPLFYYWGGSQLYYTMYVQNDESVKKTKEVIETHFTKTRDRGGIQFAEQGRMALLGQSWVFFVCLMVVLLYVVGSWFQQYHLWRQVAYTMSPWVFFGIVMQLGTPYQSIGYWKRDEQFFLWGASTHGGPGLERAINKILEDTKSKTNARS